MTNVRKSIYKISIWMSIGFDIIIICKNINPSDFMMWGLGLIIICFSEDFEVIKIHGLYIKFRERIKFFDKFVNSITLIVTEGFKPSEKGIEPLTKMYRDFLELKKDTNDNSFDASLEKLRVGIIKSMLCDIRDDSIHIKTDQPRTYYEDNFNDYIKSIIADEKEYDKKTFDDLLSNANENLYPDCRINKIKICQDKIEKYT